MHHRVVAKNGLRPLCALMRAAKPRPLVAVFGTQRRPRPLVLAFAPCAHDCQKVAEGRNCAATTDGETTCDRIRARIVMRIMRARAFWRRNARVLDITSI